MVLVETTCIYYIVITMPSVFVVSSLLPVYFRQVMHVQGNMGGNTGNSINWRIGGSIEDGNKLIVYGGNMY